MKKQLLSLLTITTLSLGALTANSTALAADDDSGFYLGIGVQRSNFDRGSVASSDTKGNLSAGYMFNDRWGVDGTLYNFIDEKKGNRESRVAGFALTGVYKIPVSSNIDVYGKAGIIRTGIELRENGRKVFDDAGQDPIIGLGVKYDFGKHNILFEYSKVDPGNANLDMMALGYRYEF